MKARIARLNAVYVGGKFGYSQYLEQAHKMLDGLDWQKRLQFENMLLTSLV